MPGYYAQDVYGSGSDGGYDAGTGIPIVSPQEPESYGYNYNPEPNQMSGYSGDGMIPIGSASDWNERVGTTSRIGLGGSPTAVMGKPLPANSGARAGAISAFAPPFSVPTYNAPTYSPPEYDQSRQQFYTQRHAMPYMSDLRRTIRQAVSSARSVGSPVVSRYILEGAMAGAGSGMGKIMGEASEYGTKAYGEEYGRLLDSYKTQYEAERDAATKRYAAELMRYQNILNTWPGAIPMSQPVAGQAINQWQ